MIRQRERRVRKQYAKTTRYILEFLESDKPIEELPAHTYSTAETCAVTHYLITKRLGLSDSLGVMRTYDRVYIYKKEFEGHMLKVKKEFYEPEYLIPAYPKRGKMTDEIIMFFDSNVECAEIDISGHSSITSAYASWRHAADMCDMLGNVRVRRKHGRLFLLREDRWEEPTD